MGGFKAFVGSIVAAGCAQVVGNIIDATTPPNAKWTARMLTWVGAASLCWMAGVFAGDYAERCVESTNRIFSQLIGDDEIDKVADEEATKE